MKQRKINWKVRFQNKTWLAAFLGLILTFVYTVLGMFDVVPHITESLVSELLLAVLNLLVAVGVIVDPTTAGAADSKEAMQYEKPKER